MRIAPFLAAALPFAAAALAACTPQGDFPSLARRPIEADLSIEEPERTPVELASDAGLRARVAELRGEAAVGDRAFEAALGAAEAAVGRAGANGTESWIEAQQALSRLEAAREATMRALGALDQLAVARVETATNSGDFSALSEAMASVERMAAGQQQRFDRLRDRLSAR